MLEIVSLSPVGFDGGVEKSREACSPRNQLIKAKLKKWTQHSRWGEKLKHRRVHRERAETCRYFCEDVDLMRHLSAADLEFFPLYILGGFKARRH